jgi:hypothetical protein
VNEGIADTCKTYIPPLLYKCGALGWGLWTGGWGIFFGRGVVTTQRNLGVKILLL